MYTYVGGLPDPATYILLLLTNTTGTDTSFTIGLDTTILL